MPFNLINDTVDQGRGPYCGAACAIYVSHWLSNTAVDPGAVPNEIQQAMRSTAFTRCTDELGSTPANIATFLKAAHPQARIYAPTEILTNWSSRPWYCTLRLGLQSCLALNWSLGFGCFMPSGTLGVDYLVIKMVSKSFSIPCSGDYFTAHFIVDIGNNQIMDPDGGHIKLKNNFLRGGCGHHYASIGLDLRVYKPAQVNQVIHVQPQDV